MDARGFYLLPYCILIIDRLHSPLNLVFTLFEPSIQRFLASFMVQITVFQYQNTYRMHRGK